MGGGVGSTEVGNQESFWQEIRFSVLECRVSERREQAEAGTVCWGPRPSNSPITHNDVHF